MKTTIDPRYGVHVIGRPGILKKIGRRIGRILCRIGLHWMKWGAVHDQGETSRYCRRQGCSRYLFKTYPENAGLVRGIKFAVLFTLILAAIIYGITLLLR